MASITLSNALFYRYGANYAVDQVGNAWDSSAGKPEPTVARYTFVAPDVGASAVSLAFAGWYLSHGNHLPLRFYIGTDPSSHVSADSSYAYTGDLTIQSDNKTFGGSADIMLVPGTTYYLWVFPAGENYGIYSWSVEGTLTTTGGGGLIHIDNGTALEGYSVYIEDGSEWAMYMPYLDTGSSWEPCG